MKLFGAKRHGRHLPENVGSEPSASVSNNKNSNAKARGKGKGPKRWIKIAIISVAVAAFAVIGVFALDMFTETEILIRPPEVNPVPRPSIENPGNPSNTGQSGVSSNSPARVLRTDDDSNRFFTFLILGLDEGGLTDVIMAARLDTEENSLNVVSIPRDTLVNVPWSLRMANSILPNMRHRYRAERDPELREELAMQATVEMFADVLGFEVDFWVTVNMRAFRTLVDAVGGIDFYVPVDMNYRDRYAGLHINFRRGMHYGLTGQQSLEILRFRSFGTGDIGRINVQQQFLTAAVEQILANRSSLATISNLTALADVAFNEINTDIDSALHLLWFAQRFFELEPGNIRFATIPHVMNDFIVNRGYVVIVLDEWLEMLNEMLNSFEVPKVAEDLSVLTRGADRRLFSSDGNWAGGNANWGSGSRGPAQPQGGGTTLDVTGGGGGGGAANGGGNAATTPTGGGAAQTPTTPPQEGIGAPTGDGETDSEDPAQDSDEYPGEDILYNQITGDDTEDDTGGDPDECSNEPPYEADYPQAPDETELSDDSGDGNLTQPTYNQYQPTGDTTETPQIPAEGQTSPYPDQAPVTQQPYTQDLGNSASNEESNDS